MWKTAHSKVWPYLVYKATDNEGHPLPEPKRTFGEPAVQAITEAGLQFTDKRKAILGIYDAQLGARSNENSGRGILARKQQGELGNFHYVDNLTRAIRHRGRILIDLIPQNLRHRPSAEDHRRRRHAKDADGQRLEAGRQRPAQARSEAHVRPRRRNV
jgi:hypothetical protein